MLPLNNSDFVKTYLLQVGVKWSRVRKPDSVPGRQTATFCGIPSEGSGQLEERLREREIKSFTKEGKEGLAFGGP